MGKRKIADTSKAAYDSLDPEKISKTQQKIINALADINKWTHQNIAYRAKISDGSCWKRLGELREAGFIERTTERWKLTSGSLGSVYKLTEKGWKSVKEGVMPGKTIADYSRAINQVKPSPNTV